jgi:tetratricopeptide (TPR) repeat protein
MSKISLEQEPDNASYLDTYGWICFKLGDYDDAILYIKKSLSKNGSSAVVNDHLGDAYYAKGDNDNAVIYWNKALELSPNSTEIKKKIENIKK